MINSSDRPFLTSLVAACATTLILYCSAVSFANDERTSLNITRSLIEQITATRNSSRLSQRLMNQSVAYLPLGLSATPALKLQNNAEYHSSRHTQEPSVWVTIDAYAVQGEAENLLLALQGMGLRHIERYGSLISGELLRASLPRLDDLPSLVTAQISKMHFFAGQVVTAGDQAHKADLARANFGVDGSGITVGVISDSYNCLQGELEDKQLGELPDNAYALEEARECGGRSDEGRALMQIIHDLAPQAKLVFHSGANGTANFANGIIELVDKAGAQVIIDDSSPTYNLFFQDDLLVQAINEVTRRGVTYISAAGNNGRFSYENAYSEYASDHLPIKAHDFSRASALSDSHLPESALFQATDSGADAGDSEADVFQTISLQAGTELQLILQWDEPAASVSGSPGAQSDLDIFLLDESASIIVASSAVDNIGKDAIEILNFTNGLPNSGQDGAQNQTTLFNLMITNAGETQPGFLKYSIIGRFNGSIDEYATNSSSIAGHQNGVNVITVGAADTLETPTNGVDPARVRFFSSAGGTHPYCSTVTA